MNRYSFLIIITIFFSACTVKYDNNILKESSYQQSRINYLSNMIQELSILVNKEESRAAAYEAIKHSRELANEYTMITPPTLHNVLVNINMRDKGLCYHFANDLMAHLQKQKYKTFKFFRIVSNKGEYDEHGSVLLTRDDIKFENSIVLDAWRDSGELFFIKVKDDKEYKWEKK